MPFNTTPAAVHYDEYLTSFATNYYVEQNYLANRVFGQISVPKRNNKYYVFSAAEENRELPNFVKEAAPFSRPNMLQLTQSTDSYFVRPYEGGFYIDEYTEANEDEMLRSRERLARTLVDNLAKDRDRTWISTYLTSGVWGEDLEGTTDFVKWSDAASKPIDDIMAWKEAFEIRNYSLKPNKVVISKDIKRWLLTNPQILGRINGGATVANPAMVNDAIIAAIFEVEEIIWADAVSNNTAHGAAEAPARMVTDRLLMVHDPADNGIDVASSGKIFTWSQIPGANLGIEARIFNGDAERKNKLIEEVHMFMNYDMKVTGPNLGTYVSDLV